MSWQKEMFGHEKPVIGLLHLGAMPGDPRYAGSMDTVLTNARADLHALQNGGVDGVLISNEFSLPYQQCTDTVTVASMAYVIGALRGEITVPHGVDVIMDAASAIDLAAAVGARFIRSIFTGAYAGDTGVFNTDVAAVLRRKAALRLDDVRLLYFLNCETDVPLAPRELAAVAKSVIFSCEPDVLCVSGPGAGQEPDSAWIKSAKAAAGDTPVFANTGCRAENIREKLAVADGCCVGTTFKYDGAFNKQIDEKRVAAFMAQVALYRQGG